MGTYDENPQYDVKEFLGFRNNYYTFSFRIVALLLEFLFILGLLGLAEIFRIAHFI